MTDIPHHTLILEGLCTTRNDDGSINVAPMGPIVDRELTSFHFRPFSTSRTFQNLKRTGAGVFHITDDVELLAKAAIGHLTEIPQLMPCVAVEGMVLAECCRWFEFRVVSIDESQPRTEIATELVHAGRVRDFFGLNRAKHAVLEAAILATRLHLLPREEIAAELEQLAVIVKKTAGIQEHAAFNLLRNHIESTNS